MSEPQPDRSAAEPGLHPFDATTALTRIDDHEWGGELGDAYWNMVGPFGGIIAAILFRSTWNHSARVGEPVALTVNFCAALAKGPFTVAVMPARTSRSTQHWTMTLRQDGATIAIGTAMFGARPHTFSHRQAQPPRTAPFESLPRFAIRRASWIDRYDLRFIEGAAQWRGSEAKPVPTRSVQWCRDDPPRPLDFVGLTAHCDVFFARILHVRPRMSPFGSVAMSVYFHATTEEIAVQGTEPVLGVCDARIFDRGFHDQSAEVWSSCGSLLATTHQVIYYRD